MDLLCRVSIPASALQATHVNKSYFESATLTDVSVGNILLFTSSCPLATPGDLEDEDAVYDRQQTAHFSRLHGASGFSGPEEASHASLANTACSVYVTDLNTPWDVHRVTSKSRLITTLKWDSNVGDSFLLADESGRVEVWRRNSGDITQWNLVASTTFDSERFVSGQFINEGRRLYIDTDKTDCPFKEKFQCRSPPDAGTFTDQNIVSLALVSTSGLAVVLCYDADETGTTADGPATVENERLTKAVRSLGHVRARVTRADVAYMTPRLGSAGSDSAKRSATPKLVVAVTNGDPKSPIRFFRLVPSIDENAVISQTRLKLDVEPLPGLSVADGASRSTGDSIQSDSDSCRAVVDLKFVTGDDNDSIVIATQHPSGGRVQLWELKEFPVQPHKIFGDGGVAGLKGRMVLQWDYSETFNGPPASVLCLASCRNVYQTGRGAACYVTVAYGDGSIQCLLRDSLQQIGSVDVPSARSNKVDLLEPPASKIARCLMPTSHMSFSANGNVLVVLDSLGQACLYRMCPTAEPGGSHTPSTLTNQYSYALLTGMDSWDIQICMKGSQVESICERLVEQYHKQQTMSGQVLLHSRFKALRMSMLRLPMQEMTDYKAADLFADLMLTSIQGVFKALCRPTNQGLQANKETTLDTVSNFLKTKMDKEGDMTRLVEAVVSKNRLEFLVDTPTLQGHQNLIQWTCGLACHLMASVPELKHRKGPGMTLINENRIQNMLREMLLVVRLWSKITPSARPTFTKTTDDYDVVHRLFYLVTKYKENPSDESIREECLLLPSKVLLLPRVNTVIPPRGIAPLIVGLNKVDMRLEYGHEPETELFLCNSDLGHPDLATTAPTANPSHQLPGGEVMGPTATGGSRDWVFVEGDPVLGGRRMLVDNVRQMYIGRHPPALKMCTRCTGVTVPNPYTNTRNQHSHQQGWENRWLSHCPCGGLWKTAPYNE